MKNNEKGIVLITTLVLGLVALAFIGALLYLLTSGTKISGTQKRYYTALEAAKGGAQIVISKLLSNGDITCNGGKTCASCPDTEKDNCKIDINLSSFGNYNIEAYQLNLESSGNAKIYTIRVKAKNLNKLNEKAEIEFVYKVE